MRIEDRGYLAVSFPFGLVLPFCLVLFSKRAIYGLDRLKHLMLEVLVLYMLAFGVCGRNWEMIDKSQREGCIV